MNAQLLMNSIRHAVRPFVVASAGLLASVGGLRADVVVHGTSVNLYHAQDLLGMRVMSADGRRVGAISDFVFDFHGQPRLTDVVVRSGALGWFGDARLVPIAALRQQGDHCQEDLSRRAFAAIAPLSYDIDGYLAKRGDLTALDREFHVPARPLQGRYITYSSLLRTRLIGSDGANIGIVADALITLNQHEVFYLGVLPTFDVFQPSEPGTWLEIPASTFVRKYNGEIHISIPGNGRLSDAPYATSVRNLSVADSRLGQVFHLAVS